MPRFPILLLAATGVAVGAVPVAAQSIEQDVRCMIASNVFSTAEKDPARKQLASAAALFYAGRVDARLAPPQIKAQLLLQGKTMTGQTVGPLMTACAQAFQAKERGLQAIGQDIARLTAPKK